MPAALFAGTTAISALLWVILVFAAIALAPTHVASARQRLSLIGLVALAFFALLHACRKWSVSVQRWVAITIDRIKKWEFWPAWLFYAPVVILCASLGIRYRGLALPAVANLNQKNGGIIGESKIDILQELTKTSPEFTADAFLVGRNARGKT